MTNRSSKKIPAHYGMPDYYKFFCKKYPQYDIDKQTFNDLISEFNKFRSKSLIKNLKVHLPFRLGDVEVVKEKREVYLNEDGVVINTNPVDWKATNHLWETNEKAKEKKILIRHINRHTDGYVFSIYYNKRTAIYKNKKIYFFKPVRELARSINDRINDYSKTKYDTYIKNK